MQKRAPRYLRRERLTARECEVDLSGGVCLKRAFPDPQGVLNTAYDDLDALLREGGLAAADDDNAYTVTVTAAPTDCYEAYAITIDACSAAITANDTEGIRRGIYAFEDMLLAADGPFLPCGNYQRQPWLKTRISRCFFSPVKRWPVNTDELLDDVNYYPDEYLNRLAHEGINGLWLVVALRELGKPASLTATRKQTAALLSCTERSASAPATALRSSCFALSRLPRWPATRCWQRIQSCSGQSSEGGICFVRVRRQPGNICGN